MLNTIKDLIKQKTAFQEAADLILEDEQIDDSIILLHEESDDLEISEDAPAEEENKEDAPEEGEAPAENGDDQSAETPAEDKPEDKPEDGDILDQPIEDELPEPVGTQTGEPAEIGDGDILSTEIDLATNTPNDTLPVPPAGAADVVPGADTTRVDSGFSTADVSEEDDSRDVQSEEEAADILDLPIDEEAEIPDPNGVAKKEEKPEEKARDKATPTEDTKEFKDTFNEDFDILNESIDDVKEETEPEEKTEEAEESEPTEEKCEKKEDCDDTDEKKDDAEEKEVAPKTESNDKPKVKYDKTLDLSGMSADQIKASIDPGMKAKLESAGIFDKFIEAISIGDTPAADEGTTDQPPVDDTATDVSTDAAPTDQPADNAVTAAVKDKLGEMNSADTEPNPAASKEAILKKLTNLTKTIEDTKNLVIDSAK